MPPVSGVKTYDFEVGGTAVLMPGTAFKALSTIEEPVIVSPLPAVAVVFMVTGVPAATVRATPGPAPASIVRVGVDIIGATVIVTEGHGVGNGNPPKSLPFRVP